MKIDTFELRKPGRAVKENLDDDVFGHGRDFPQSFINWLILRESNGQRDEQRLRMKHMIHCVG